MKNLRKKKINDFFLLISFYETFYCGRYNVFIIIFFVHENMKKLASKIAHNCPKSFFFQ